MYLSSLLCSGDNNPATFDAPVDPGVLVDPSVLVDPGVWVDPGVVDLDVLVDSGVLLDPGVQINPGALVNPGVPVNPSVVLVNPGVRIDPPVVLVDTDVLISYWLLAILCHKPLPPPDLLLAFDSYHSQPLLHPAESSRVHSLQHLTRMVLAQAWYHEQPSH